MAILFHSYQQALEVLHALPSRIPASFETINELERNWGCEVPVRLRELLLLDSRVYTWMFNIPSTQMHECRDDFNRILIEDGSSFQFSSTDIVVWHHQGYLFDFFQSSPADDDPILWNMYSSDHKPSSSNTRLTDRWMSCFKKYLEAGTVAL